MRRNAVKGRWQQGDHLCSLRFSSLRKHPHLLTSVVIMTQLASIKRIHDDLGSRTTARAEAALIHPATLLALATLLANDLVFKWLWPGSWITGKLSDLAWVIFASPLLALPLTFLARRNTTAQRAAWAIAYIGLPLLYAAYNTFEPVHDIVMGVFAFLRGTPGGSSFDPTDSIVIPIGMGIALLVWRNANPNTAATSTRTGLLIAAIASIASVATGAPAPPTGVTSLSQDQSGVMVAKEYYDREFFSSQDGGINWGSAPESVTKDEAIDWESTTADTPDGTYSLQGRNLIRTVDGAAIIEYSTVKVNPSADTRIFALSTDSYGGDFVPYPKTPQGKIQVQDVHYDEKSGNLIITRGLQGVEVRTPDGRWHRIGVGEYTPIDYSVANRAKLLMHSDELLFIAIALTLASIALALTMSVLPVDTSSLKYLGASLTATVATVVVVPLLIVGLGYGFVLLLRTFRFLDGVSSMFTLFLAFLGVAGFVAVIVATRRVFRVPFSTIATTVITFICFAASIVPLIYYTEKDTLFGYEKGFTVLGAIAIGLVSIGFIVAASAKLASIRSTIAMTLATVAMIVAIEFVFLIWISGRLAMAPAKIASTAIVWTIAAILYMYARNIWSNKPEDPDGNGHERRR